MLLNYGVREDSWESLGLQGNPISQSQRKSILNIHWKDWCWNRNSILWPPDAKSWLIGKDPDAGKDWRQEEKGRTEDELVGWHHWVKGHEFEHAPEAGDGQGGPVCCNPWCHKELDTTEWLNWTELTENSSISQSSKEWRPMPFQDKEASKLWNSIWGVAMQQGRKRLTC